MTSVPQYLTQFPSPVSLTVLVVLYFYQNPAISCILDPVMPMNIIIYTVYYIYLMYYTAIAGQIYHEHMTHLPLPLTFFYLAGIVAFQYLSACEVSICCCWWFSPLWIWWCWLLSCFARSTILKNACVVVCQKCFWCMACWCFMVGFISDVFI